MTTLKKSTGQAGVVRTTGECHVPAVRNLDLQARGNGEPGREPGGERKDRTVNDRAR